MSGAEDEWGAVGLPRSRGAALTFLFHVHYRRLVGLAGLLVDDRESAEEVVQDAFERLYRRWGQSTAAATSLPPTATPSSASTSLVVDWTLTAAPRATPELGK